MLVRSAGSCRRGQPISWSREVEEDAFRSLAGETAVNTIGKLLQHPAHACIEQVLQVLQQELAADQLGELLLLFHDFTVFLFDAAQRVEVAWMHDLAQDAGVQEAALIDTGDLL